MVAGPLVQIHQQVADIAGFSAAATGLQHPHQGFGKGFGAFAGGPLAQAFQIGFLGVRKTLGGQGLARHQAVLPGQSLVFDPLAQVPFAPQLAQVLEAAGLNPSMTQAKQGLVAFEPKPGCGPLGRVAGIAKQVDKIPQIEAWGGLGPIGRIGFAASRGARLGH